MPLKNLLTYLARFFVLGFIIFSIYMFVSYLNELRLARNNTIQVQQLREKGEFQKALPLVEKAYSLTTEELGEKHISTLINLNNLAIIYQDLGRFEQALALFEKGYRLRTEVLGEKHVSTLRSLNNLANIYLNLGRFEQALPLFEKDYRLTTEELGEKHADTLTSLNNLANIYQNLGRFEQALPLLEKGYRLKTHVCEKHPRTLTSLNNLASIYQDLGRFEQALPLFKKGYRLRTEVLGEKHADTLTSLNNLASIYQDLGRFEQTLSWYEKGYRLASEMLGEKHPHTLIYLNNLGYAHAELGHLDKAIELLEQSIKNIESLRQSGELSVENRQALFKQWIPAYFLLSRYYIIKNRVNDAFHTAEKIKARTLLESMTLRLAVQKVGLNQVDLQKLQQYQADIANFNQRIAKADELDKKLALEMEKNQLVRQAAQFHRTLMQDYPKYAQLNTVQIVDVKTGASLIPEDALFISYLLDDQNNIIVFTLDSTGNLQAKDLGRIPNLDQTLKTYAELLGEPCPVKEWAHCHGGKSVLRLEDGSFVIKDEISHQEKSQRINNVEEISRYLGKLLLAPVQAHFAGKQRLIISPAGALALMPFETLILENQPLIATYQVSYVQSLSVLVLLKQREALYQAIENRETLLAMGVWQYQPPGQTIAPKMCNKSQRILNYDLETMLSRNIADPQRYQRAYQALEIRWCNLPDTEKELLAIEKIFTDTQPLILKNAQATEAKLQSLNQQGILTRYRYLLFSAHGYLSLETPALSAIVLDQLSDKIEQTDGFITASEWPGYHLKSDLMVLSACQTGVGKVIHGEGIMGLPYALYVAGNKNTLLTLWSVLDDSTAEFTARFFNKLKAGMGQVEAITATKREFFNGEKYKLPLYWAPFVLYGI